VEVRSQSKNILFSVRNVKALLFVLTGLSARLKSLSILFNRLGASVVQILPNSDNSSQFASLLATQASSAPNNSAAAHTLSPHLGDNAAFTISVQAPSAPPLWALPDTVTDSLRPAPQDVLSTVISGRARDATPPAPESRGYSHVQAPSTTGLNPSQKERGDLGSSGDEDLKAKRKSAGCFGIRLFGRKRHVARQVAS